MKMRFIDLHCDTMTRKGGTPLAEWTGHVTPEKLRRGGALAQCFALYILTREPALRRPVGGPARRSPGRLAASCRFRPLL